MKILVSGLINQETNVKVHNFPVNYEPVVYAFNEVNTSISGVAYNIINALSYLGDEVVPVSIIGNDHIGKLIKDEIKALDMSTTYIKKDLDNTCSSVILYDDNGKRKIYCDLKNIQDLVYPIKKLDSQLKDCDGIVICNINFNDELINNVRKYNKPIFTDVHVLRDINDSYNKRFLQNADVVFLSDEGITGNYEEFLISIYNTYHNKVIVLGMGSKGAMLLDQKSNKVRFIKSVYTRPVINTVGAGDSLFSSFVHYYVKGLDSLDCLKRAITFASYKIGESGGAKGFFAFRHSG